MFIMENIISIFRYKHANDYYVPNLKYSYAWNIIFVFIFRYKNDYYVPV